MTPTGQTDGLTDDGTCKTDAAYYDGRRITLTVTDYREHRQTLFPAQKVNLKACRPIILNPFVQLIPGDWTHARRITVQT